ncbi:MAG: flagellar export protein FliJ [Sterolibacterium sp.]|nr:flagellar export protein FliJ [Sterolibacterium sp.]
MSKLFPLQTLLDLSQLRMDEASRKLGELLASEQEANGRLTLLQQYRVEYRERFMAAASNGIDRNTLNNYQVFLQRLDEAVLQAQALVEQSKQHTARGQQEWLDKRGRLKAYDTLSTRHQVREQHIENRKEQKLLDEHAARKHGNTKASTMP